MSEGVSAFDICAQHLTCNEADSKTNNNADEAADKSIPDIGNVVQEKPRGDVTRPV